MRFATRLSLSLGPNRGASAFCSSQHVLPGTEAANLEALQRYYAVAMQSLNRHPSPGLLTNERRRCTCLSFKNLVGNLTQIQHSLDTSRYNDRLLWTPIGRHDRARVARELRERAKGECELTRICSWDEQTHLVTNLPRAGVPHRQRPICTSDSNHTAPARLLRRVLAPASLPQQTLEPCRCTVEAPNQPRVCGGVGGVDGGCEGLDGP